MHGRQVRQVNNVPCGGGKSTAVRGVHPQLDVQLRLVVTDRPVLVAPVTVPMPIGAPSNSFGARPAARPRGTAENDNGTSSTSMTTSAIR